MQDVYKRQVVLWKKYGPSKTRADLKEYYGITSEDQVAVIVNNEVLESKGRIAVSYTHL